MFLKGANIGLMKNLLILKTIWQKLLRIAFPQQQIKKITIAI